MKTRTLQEIKDLDEDLHLFEENDWDFFAVVDTQEENYEYFNDVRDSDFVKTKGVPTLGIAAICMVGLVVISAIVLIRVNSDREYINTLQSLASVNGAANTTYVDGEQASSEELISVAQLFKTYQDTLTQDIESLDKYVKGGSSVVSEYKNAKSGIKVMYDGNDIYARAIKEMASITRFNRVNKLIEKNGDYYCYIEVSYPSSTDIYEYIYLYQYNLTKFAMSNELTEEALGKYFIESLSDNSLPVTSTETLIMLEKSGNGFTIKDDSWLRDIYIADYRQAIQQMTSMLSDNLSVGGY